MFIQLAGMSQTVRDPVFLYGLQDSLFRLYAFTCLSTGHEVTAVTEGILLNPVSIFKLDSPARLYTVKALFYSALSVVLFWDRVGYLLHVYMFIILQADGLLLFFPQYNLRKYNFLKDRMNL